MKERSLALSEALAEWRLWAVDALRDHDGWETCYMDWPKVARLTWELLREPDLSLEEISLIAAVIGLSAEDEDIADWLKANRGAVATKTIQSLLSSADPQVRWQVYDSLDWADESSRAMLLHGTLDGDAYVRRRAFLRLVSFGTPPRQVLERAESDSDDVMRDVAREILRRA